MKVNLIKEAEYELNEEKCTKINFDTFSKMTNAKAFDQQSTTIPNVRIFSSVDEFRDCNLEMFDTTKDVYVLSNGQFCVFLKGKCEQSKKTNTDESTNTEESKRKEP